MAAIVSEDAVAQPSGDEREVGSGGPSRHPAPLPFFLLVFLLSFPIWLISGLAGRPAFNTVGVICPLLAALILTGQGGVPGVERGSLRKAFLRRAVDHQRIRPRIWYVPILLLMPTVMVLSFLTMRAMGTEVPLPRVTVWMTVALFLASLFAAAGEELGWMGCAFHPMEERWGALKAGLALGVTWAVWHYVPYLEADRSLEWIAWQTLFMVATRVLIVWVFVHTGRSVFGAILFHAVSNVCVYLFPEFGSSYDPMIAGVITAMIAAGVVMRWKPDRR